MSTTHVALPAPEQTRATRWRYVLLSEFTKLRTVRSTYWSFLVTLVLVAGLSILISSAIVSRWDQRPIEERLTFDPTAIGLSGTFLGQLAVGVLGVLVITSEYATGSIRLSLAAVPQRLRLLSSKVVVFTVVSLIVGLAATFASYLGSQAVFSAKQAQSHLGDTGVLRAVVGAAAYLTLVGLLGLGIGGIVRRTPAAISLLVGLLLVVPILVNFLPQSWQQPIARYLPSAAGGAMFSVRHVPGVLTPGKGLITMPIWVLVSLVAAAVVLVRRDA